MGTESMDEGREHRSRVWAASQIPHSFRELLHALLDQASRGLVRHDFLKAACESLLEFSGCDLLELRLSDGGRCFRGPAEAPEPTSYTRQVIGERLGFEGPGERPLNERIWNAILSGRLRAASPSYTRSGSLWTGDTARPILLRDLDSSGESQSVVIGGEMASVAYLPVPVKGGASGVLNLGSRRRDFFTKENVLFFEAAAETLGVALSYQGTQWALRERVKELTCLYGIARVTQQPSISENELLREAVELLPPGWQYPEITCARITLNGRSFESKGFREGPFRQSAPLLVQGEPRGIVEVLYNEERPTIDEGPFLREERNLIDAVAEMLGAVLSRRRAQWALGERVKELTCLYGIAEVAQEPNIPEDDLLRRIADLLPPGWQHPDVTTACISLDGRIHSAPGFRPGRQRQSAEITVSGRVRGTVDVFYTREMPPADEGPFLREERSLIDEVARQVGLIVERRETEREKLRLQDQLRHADRLATIGQLAAGAAHELNEPLGSILGFAELVRYGSQLPQQAEEDVDKIVQAALHAREVVRKLLLFARQVPARKAPVDVNKLVQEGLYFLELRCKRQGIRLVRDLASGLPEIAADPAQIHQVLVNLVVNAIQAMPAGGVLTIATGWDREHVILSVEDTGAGMSDEVLRQIFVPFFTTKEVGQGTGLGLSVVHGIVTSHGGTVQVRSEVGKGSRFQVRLPLAPTTLLEEVT